MKMAFLCKPHGNFNNKYFVYLSGQKIPRCMEILEGIDIDVLEEKGKRLVFHINHREYTYKGFHFYVGWQSPCKRLKTLGGWFIYKAEELI